MKRNYDAEINITGDKGAVNGSGKVVYKHGAVLPITDKEYRALTARYL